MPENFEVTYSHPDGASATFFRHDGELDAVAKSLDAEQFWVFKQVKALLVRNDEDDLSQSNDLMRAIGFTSQVRVITAPPVLVLSQPAVDESEFAEEHTGPHLPGPSYWPLALGASATVALGGFMFFQTTLAVIAIGLVLVFISMIGWGLEAA